MITDTCQRWTEHRESRRPAGELIRTAGYDVAPIATDAEARAFVERHHYAGNASSTAHRFGLYRNGELAGVALFGPPPSVNAHMAVFPTLTNDEGVTLGRLVLLEDVPGNGESWFVTRCFELLRESGVVAVESCADPQPRSTEAGELVHRGHLGIVYQATNGRYVGKTDPASLSLLPDGTCLSKRAQSKIRKRERGWERSAAPLIRIGAEPLRADEDAGAWLARWRLALTRPMRHHGNHRYLWCLDPKRHDEVIPKYGPFLPYPKMH